VRSASAALPIVRPLDGYWLSYAAILLGGAVLLLALIAGEPRLIHWYVLPVFLCLTVVSLDTAALASGRASLFSPAGLFGFLGVQFFFLSPVLHVYLDYWMDYTVGPADWRPWLGGMAWLNLAGLIAFRLARHVVAREPRARPCGELDRSRFLFLGSVLLLVAAATQVWIYLSHGGLAGYIGAYELAKAQGETPFAGLGRAMMVAEAFPVVGFMVFALVVRTRGAQLSTVAAFAALTVLLIVCLVFGGLRGSRSNTIWVIFWATMITDCWLRPLSRRALAAGAVGLIAFMYFYGLYKGVGGAEGLGDLWQGRVTLGELEEQTEKPLSKVILTDFGRGDVQALILQRISTGAFEPVGGRTYLAALAMLVPRSLWPDRPGNKLREGSELRFGQGSYSARRVSHFVHGLAGEAMINFGPLALVPAFLIWGCAFARIDDFLRSFDPDYPRSLLAPFLVLLAVLILLADLDNLLWLLIKLVALPTLLVLLAMRWRTPPAEAAS
jgi:hypothetical protein